MLNHNYCLMMTSRTAMTLFDNTSKEKTIGSSVMRLEGWKDGFFLDCCLKQDWLDIRSEVIDDRLVYYLQRVSLWFCWCKEPIGIAFAVCDQWLPLRGICFSSVMLIMQSNVEKIMNYWGTPLIKKMCNIHNLSFIAMTRKSHFKTGRVNMCVCQLFYHLLCISDVNNFDITSYFCVSVR